MGTCYTLLYTLLSGTRKMAPNEKEGPDGFREVLDEVWSGSEETESIELRPPIKIKIFALH